MLSHGASGAGLSIIGIDERHAHCRVFAPSGAIAYDDTLYETGDNNPLALSPDGDYFFNVWQDSETLQLLPVENAKPLTVSLPAPPSPVSSTFLGFAGPQSMIVVRFFGDNSTQSYLLDVRRNPMQAVPLEPPSTAAQRPELIYPFQAGVANNGELVQAVGPEGRISCHSPGGTLLWNLPHETCPAQWVIPSDDQPIVAALTKRCLYTLDVRTGAPIDEKTLSEPIFYVYEALFSDGVIHLAGKGGNGKQQFLHTIRLSPEGRILSAETNEAIVCGLLRGESRLAIVEDYQDPQCLVVGLEKSP